MKKMFIATAVMISVFGGSCARTPNPIVGVWEGRMNELPAVELTVREDNGQLGGAIVFFFQRKDTGTWKVERQNGEPLTEATFDGKALSFRISHERAHTDSNPSEPPVLFKLTLSSPDEGELTSNYQGQESAIKLVRKR
jgi:hypothetical protein